MNGRITIRVTSDMKEALERFHKEQLTPVRSRQDAFRHIIEDWLTGHGYLEPQSHDRDGAGASKVQQERQPSDVAPPSTP